MNYVCQNKSSFNIPEIESMAQHSEIKTKNENPNIHRGPGTSMLKLARNLKDGQRRLSSGKKGVQLVAFQNRFYVFYLCHSDINLTASFYSYLM